MWTLGGAQDKVAGAQKEKHQVGVGAEHYDLEGVVMMSIWMRRRMLKRSNPVEICYPVPSKSCSAQERREANPAMGNTSGAAAIELECCFASAEEFAQQSQPLDAGVDKVVSAELAGSLEPPERHHIRADYPPPPLRSSAQTPC